MTESIMLNPGEVPPRPAEPRRVTFEDVVFHRADDLEPYLVPLEHAQPGDRQVAVFRTRGSFEPVCVDAVAELPRGSSTRTLS